MVKSILLKLHLVYMFFIKSIPGRRTSLFPLRRRKVQKVILIQRLYLVKLTLGRSHIQELMASVVACFTPRRGHFRMPLRYEDVVDHLIVLCRILLNLNVFAISGNKLDLLARLKYLSVIGIFILVLILVEFFLDELTVGLGHLLQELEFVIDSGIFCERFPLTEINVLA